jgi:16S rRNA (uracil1498-N3)-methyltransferase
VSIAPHVLVATPLAGAVPGDAVDIAPATLHHLRRVLRLGDGAGLSLTDGAGLVASGAVRDDSVVLSGPVHDVPAPRPRLVLAQALSKGRRAEDAVRVACELGVDRIVPVVAERTQGRPDARAAEALVERWRAVAVAALEQSRGAHLAQVLPPVVGVEAATSSPDALHLIAVPGAEALPAMITSLAPLIAATSIAASDAASATTSTLSELVVAVGPEGGWSPAEVERAAATGWRAVGLGPTVLRTEHAGPVAVAVVAALLGRWSGDPVDATLGATLGER